MPAPYHLPDNPDPRCSNWERRPGFAPPPTIRHPSEYDGHSPHLALACTQTELPPTQQRALVRDWCALLPTLSQVRVLWLQSKVTQELFEAACAMASLQGLYIQWSGIRNLAPIAQLAGLTHLHIGGAPAAEPIAALATLKNLIDLELHHVHAAHDLGFLQQLAQLRFLELAGNTNSLQSLQVDSLAPLRALVRLERLALSCLSVADASLAPLADLVQLRHLLISNQSPMEEFARLAGLLPQVQCERFAPVGAIDDWFTCKKCGEKSMVSLTGARQSWRCTACDAPRIARHVAQFECIKAQAQQSLHKQ